MTSEKIQITDRDEWHRRRAKNIGGSEIAALFDLQPDYAMSAYELWQVKAGRIPAPEVAGERPAWGLRLELAVAEAAAEKEGWEIEQGGHVEHPTVRGAACTLDFTVHGDPRGLGVLECKNTDWMVHRRTWTDDEPPPHILLQLQHQLACTGYGWGAVACLVGGNDLRVYHYQRNDQVVAKIESLVAAFWRSIEDGRPLPKIDWSASTGRALAALHRDDNGEMVSLEGDNHLAEVCAQFLHARDRRRTAEQDEQAAKNIIMEKVGAHRGAFCDGFTISAPTVKATPDRIFTEAMVGDVIKGRSGYRRLSVKERTQ